MVSVIAISSEKLIFCDSITTQFLFRPRVHFAPVVQPRYNQTAKWRPKSNLYGSQSQYHASMRPKAVSHTQFVNRAVKTSVQSKVHKIFRNMI